MNRLTRVIAAGLLMLSFGGAANGQVVSLLVGNQSGVPGLDRYHGTTGAAQGVFASVPSGSQFSFFKYGGPNNNLFVQQGSSVLQFNGMTGAFINTFISQVGAQFAFGPDGHCYRLERFSSTQAFPRHIGKYDGTTGVRIGTFVDASISGLDNATGSMRFGPDGNLYIDNGSTILRFNGTTGAPQGAFIPPGSGGLVTVFDAVFATNGHLIVSAINGTTNDLTYRFDGTTGAYLGIFASGINLPIGITQGPDQNIYVAASFANQIMRLDLTSGSLIDAFVPSTVHGGPSYIGFTPFPVPEPSSLIFCAVVTGTLAAARMRARSLSGRICRSSNQANA